ncbi:hypothetical protein Tco_0652801 [Tanacetum coccineum]|uniref:Uncharacterized protein n=1 Tax=Tanacetum coccineum TaxID=301880 RepID=A0ABQ4WYK5_9ASTR
MYGQKTSRGHKSKKLMTQSTFKSSTDKLAWQILDWGDMLRSGVTTRIPKKLLRDKGPSSRGTKLNSTFVTARVTFTKRKQPTEYTLKTQLLRIDMHGDETPDAYLNCAQEFADALASISEPVKDKDLVMLTVSGLCEEYNGLKTIITAHQSPTAFKELHALLSDHDYMLGKTRAPALSITSSFAVNYAVGSPSMPQAHTCANSPVTPDLEAMDNSEAYYGDDVLYVGNGKGLPVLHIGLSKVSRRLIDGAGGTGSEGGGRLMTWRQRWNNDVKVETNCSSDVDTKL